MTKDRLWKRDRRRIYDASPSPFAVGRAKKSSSSSRATFHELHSSRGLFFLLLARSHVLVRLFVQLVLNFRPARALFPLFLLPLPRSAMSFKRRVAAKKGRMLREIVGESSLACLDLKLFRFYWSCYVVKYGIWSYKTMTFSLPMAQLWLGNGRSFIVVFRVFSATSRCLEQFTPSKVFYFND